MDKKVQHAVKGRGKGSGFERDISRFLSKWWSNGERDDLFWRNRTKVTSKTPNAKHQLGDICATSSLGIPFIEVFNIECKRGYNKINPFDLIIFRKSKFITFCDQVINDSKLSNRIPLLILKQDRKEALVIIDRMDLLSLEYYIGKHEKIDYYIELVIKASTYCIFTMKDFFDFMNPEPIKLMWKKEYKGKK